MTTYIVIIALLVAALVAALVVLRFDRRQNKIIDNSLAQSLSRNSAIQDELHAKELELARETAEVDRLTRKALDDRAELEKLQASFRAEFKNLANEILEEKSRTFKQTNSESMKLILDPFRENIKEFRERVELIYSSENEQRGALKNELGKLMELNTKITRETTNLTEALKGKSKVQGDWGEMILDSLLEQSGLQKGVHYLTQANVKDSEGRNLRPDVVLNLPDEKCVVIDSKVSLTAYVDYVSAVDDVSRSAALTAHVQSVNKHFKELAGKRYQDIVDNTPEFVIMFVPNEPAFLLALQNSPDLWTEAYRRGVVITSPTNLLALLRIVYDLWQRDNQSKNVLAIAAEGGKLYDQFVDFMKDMEALRSNIERTSRSYDDAYKRLATGNNNIIRECDRLKELGAKATKTIPDKLLTKE
ncbi:MAG: DNA recombination protein RmuC [Tidjanibacter sp.]|nr:DNA recombination protein RmuC [Tidjanibacter sp.]